MGFTKQTRDAAIFHLWRFGRFLRSVWIKLIASDRRLGSAEVEEEYGRPCVVCLRRFVPRFLHHSLCDICEQEFLGCWGKGCINFFRPDDLQMSETYCPRCREAGNAQDLLSELHQANSIARKIVLGRVIQSVIRPVYNHRQWILN